MQIEKKIFEDDLALQEKIALSKLQCCNNCINLVNKDIEGSFKKIKYCESFKTEIKQEWLFVEQTPICEQLDYCPF